MIRDVIDEAVLADQLGLDFFGVGEHHRDDFAVSAPEVVLAAIAGRTARIRLGSAVTVLSSDDPVRVFQRFATLDAVSNGRAEVILGRGSFTESFPLFGYRPGDYETLFEEKLDLFARCSASSRSRGSGTTRPPLTTSRSIPRPSPAPDDVGRRRRQPESVVRAARYGLPLMLAIIGGDRERFAPFVDLYHRALDEFGKPELPVGVHSPGLRRRDRRGRRARSVGRTTGDARPDRRRARLGADGARRVRGESRRRAVRRLARDRGAQDRGRPPRRSASAASTSSTAPASCRTRR